MQRCFWPTRFVDSQPTNVITACQKNWLLGQPPCTSCGLSKFEARRDELEKLAKTNLEIAQKRKEKLDGFKISITAEANDEGLLFGSIGPYEIEKQLLENGHEIERKEIRMPDGAIKKTGEYTIGIHLGIDTDAIINLIVETNN